MKLIFTTLCLFLTLAVHATEYQLAVITSNIDGDRKDFFIEVKDNKEIDSLRYLTKDSTGRIYEDVSLPAEKIIDEGAVVVTRNGYDAVILQVENFSVSKGGTVVLNYLYNGVSGSRRFHRLNLVKAGESFELRDLEGNKVNRMYLWAHRKPIVGIVGISSVETSYKP